MRLVNLVSLIILSSKIRSYYRFLLWAGIYLCANIVLGMHTEAEVEASPTIIVRPTPQNHLKKPPFAFGLSVSSHHTTSSVVWYGFLYLYPQPTGWQKARLFTVAISAPVFPYCETSNIVGLAIILGCSTAIRDHYIEYVCNLHFVIQLISPVAVEPSNSVFCIMSVFVRPVWTFMHRLLVRLLAVAMPMIYETDRVLISDYVVVCCI